MNKIKDLIYNFSDILIAILILAIAALVIFWRLGIILSYPKQLIGTGDSGNVITQPVDYSPEDEGDNTGTGDEGEDAEGEGTGEGSDADPSTGDEGGEGSETGESDTPRSLWNEDGELTRDVKVEVEGNSATAAVECLIDVGLFIDYDDYQSVCELNDLDHEKVSAGSFTFKKGSTKKDIARKINWG